MKWNNFKKTKPKTAGSYIIHAETMDPNNPYVKLVWYDEKYGWEIPEYWKKSTTHWMKKPNPPFYKKKK